MPQQLASLSLDLDNKWSYLKTHGDAGWAHALRKPRGTGWRDQRRLDSARHRGGRSRYFYHQGRTERDDGDVPPVCDSCSGCCRVSYKSCHLHDFRRDLSGLQSSSRFQ